MTADSPRRGRHRIPLVSLVALLLAVLTVTACAKPSESGGSQSIPTGPPQSGEPSLLEPSLLEPSPTTFTFPLTVVDDEGTEVVIAAEPERIVSLTPATTEILYAIGAGGRVVGKVEDIANYPPEAADVPIVATFAGVDVEQIVALEADLVVAGGSGLSQGPAVDQLRNADVPVVVVYPTTVDGALAGIQLIGLAVGEAQAGDDLANSMAAQIGAISAITQGADQPRVFYEIDYGQSIFTPPEDSIYGEMIRLAGGQVIPGNPDYTISLESLVAADPQVILLGDAAYGATAAQVAERPGWGSLAAVAEGAVYPVDDTVITRPGPRLVDGLRELLGAIHPELVEGLPIASDP